VSWYRFAPVETTQSTYPPLSSGERAAMPSPAGVSAPETERPTVTSSWSIRSASRRAASRSRAAL